MKRVAVPLAEGFEEIEAITIVDVLRRGGVQVITFSLTSDREVTGSHQICISCDQLIGEVDFGSCDMIVLPGGMPGSMNLNNHAGLREVLLKMKSEGKFLGAICAAPLVLGNLGLADGVEMTCYPGFEKYLSGAKLSLDGVVADHKVITGRGAGFAMPFAIKLLEILSGESTAKNIAQKMLFE
jgi:protein deglycase